MVVSHNGINQHHPQVHHKCRRDSNHSQMAGIQNYVTPIREKHESLMEVMAQTQGLVCTTLILLLRLGERPAALRGFCFFGGGTPNVWQLERN